MLEQMNPMSSETFTILSLNYFPMGEYNEVYSRPYTVNLNGEALDTIREKTYDSNGSNISAQELAPVMDDIIQPSSVSIGAGVGRDFIMNPRYVFILIVSHISPTGYETISYMTGYTSHDGVTPNGAIDGEMVHYVNGIVETTKVQYNTPMGVTVSEKLNKVYNILASPTGEDAYTQRPTDIIDTITSEDIANQADTFGVSLVNVGNTLNSYGNTFKESNIVNNVASDFVTKIINSKGISETMNTVFMNGAEESYIGIPEVQEPHISDNRFIRYISKLSGLVVPSSSFKFSSLMNIDPSIYDRASLMIINNNLVNPLLANTPDVGEHWNGRDIVTIKAYSILEALTSLSLQHGFSKMIFTISNNHNALGVAEMIISDFKSFINISDVQMTQLVELLKTKCINNVFLPETRGGVVPMYAEVYIDIAGTTKINLIYDNYPPTWYTVPTFANGLFSPVVLNSNDMLQHNAQSLKGLVDTISEVRYNQNNIQHQY